MKKVMIISTIAVMLLLGLTVKAQETEGKILAGAGVGYATDINTMAIFANGVYQITDQWEASLGINYYLPKDYGFGGKLTWLGFDLDGHYVFSNSDTMDFYALAGFHITRVSTPSYEIEGHSIPSASSTSSGVNLGIGGRYQLADNLYGMGEAKYAIADGGFFQLNVGVLFRF